MAVNQIVLSNRQEWLKARNRHIGEIGRAHV